MTAQPAPLVGHLQSPKVPVIIGAALFMELLDSTAVMTALPSMAADFGEPGLRMNLVVSVYMLALALCVPLSGWAAERFRPRQVMLLAMGLFTAASLACAFAESLWQLCLGRMLQGAAGALMTPVGQVIILRWSSREQLLQSMSWLALPALVGPLLGPLLGGFLVTVLSWHWIFLVNLPICLVGCVLILRHVPDFAPRKVPPLDYRGLLLSGGALAMLVFGLESLGLGQLPQAWALGLIGGGVVCALGYLLHARRHASPLVDLSLLRLRSFGVAQAGGGLFRLGSAAQPFLLILLLQNCLGMSPLAAGWLVVSGGVGALLMKLLAVPLVRRYGYRRVLSCNAVASGLGIALCATFDRDTAVWLMAVVLFAAGLVRSLQFSTLGAASYQDVPGERSAAASSLSAMSVQLSMAMSVSLAGVMLGLLAGSDGRVETSVADIATVMLVCALLCVMSGWVFRRLAN
ncbi:MULTISPECIES: MFS transporter [Pseudomonas]|uniref:EmrB/QacA subfamily drug resistance transporter n=1 Tax=Pseudomonas hunanensis TaxID=1247546 RepID=A0ACC6K5Y6_9PSED|nr:MULTISPECIES: MFS transporter [Pseudomonas]MBP2261910.1 EmrB/QacA subfamily drug resistance transporter [Pseudomonas sp. BP8]MDR6713791.1 EmrB/QacA subfamily drug resistance transporter [Pseudomonas hunanensis]HDS1734708.1 MFS transporter [Pseudomonas putida]